MNVISFFDLVGLRVGCEVLGCWVFRGPTPKNISRKTKKTYSLRLCVMWEILACLWAKNGKEMME